MKKHLGFVSKCALLTSGLLLSSFTMVAQQPTTPSSPSPGSQSSPSGPGSATTDRTMDQMQRQGEHMDEGAKKMSKSGDEMFAIKAAQGGAAEVKMGQLAAEKASDADVKAFGQQMADDHTKANEKLMAIAKEKKMTLPSDLDSKQQKTYDKLSKLSGPEFDKAYVKDMVKDHEGDVKAFTKESEKGKDEQIKSFATETLPVLQGHLEKIKGISGKMASGGNATK